VRDTPSLDRLVVDHLPAALRFATRLTGDASRAEEIVQDSLLRVVRRWSGFRGEAEFKTWFFRIIINVFRDRLRGPAGPRSIDDSQADVADAKSAGPPEAAMAGEFERLIAQEVSGLPTRQREVLVLIVYERLAPREVANVVGISEANVYSTLSAARSRLKARLAAYMSSNDR
jgi:RNA polymerase sigma-70 factor (ECF subfamily)